MTETKSSVHILPSQKTGEHPVDAVNLPPHYAVYMFRAQQHSQQLRHTNTHKYKIPP